MHGAFFHALERDEEEEHRPTFTAPVADSAVDFFFPSAVAADQERDPFEQAVDAQVVRARSYRRAVNSLQGSYYADQEVGGYIFEGTSWFSSKPTVSGYTLDDINIRAPSGLQTKPALFGGCLHCAQEGAAPLVIAVPPHFQVSDIYRNSRVYLNRSRRLKAPVFVISNDDLVVKFNDGQTIQFSPVRN